MSGANFSAALMLLLIFISTLNKMRYQLMYNCYKQKIKPQISFEAQKFTLNIARLTTFKKLKGNNILCTTLTLRIHLPCNDCKEIIVDQSICFIELHAYVGYDLKMLVILAIVWMYFPFTKIYFFFYSNDTCFQKSFKKNIQLKLFKIQTFRIP